jgi:hypothetical protein
LSLTGVPEGGIHCSGNTFVGVVESLDAFELLKAFCDSETLCQKYRGNSDRVGEGESSSSVEDNGLNNTFKLNDSDLTLLLYD